MAENKSVGLTRVDEWVSEEDVRKRLIDALDQDLVKTLVSQLYAAIDRRLETRTASLQGPKLSESERNVEELWLRYLFGRPARDAGALRLPYEPARVRSLLVAWRAVELTAMPPLPQSLSAPLARGSLPKDDEVGSATAERAMTYTHCQAGNSGACLRLGALADEPGRANTPLAIAALQRACDAGIAPGCRMLGGFYFNGVGVKRDLAAEAWLRRRGCDLGDLTSCYLVGYRYMEGFEGVPADPLQAQILFRLGCEGGIRESCVALEGLRL